MINITIIRKKVLELAMSGQISEHKSVDGTGAELYERIKHQIQTLEKQGVIKRGKKLPEVPDDEKMFDIPQSWTWAYLGEVFQHNTGKALNSSDTEGVLLDYITTSNLYWDRFELNSIKQMHFKPDEIEKCTVTKGDLLICEGGDIGRSAIWNYEYDIRIQNHIHKLRAYLPNETNAEFFFYLMWLYKQNGFINGRGIGLQGFSSRRLHSLVVPLPPYNEQVRIVDTINAVFENLDIIDRLQNDFSKNAIILSDKLIDAGIRGELTKQLADDGTAAELLERIAEEKKQLMMDGKIPKEKKLQDIKPEEIPFEIPETWKWVRVQDVASYITDYVANGSFATLKAHTKTYKEPNYALFVRTMDLSSGFKEGCSYIDKESYDFLEKSRLFGGELILPNIGASIGKAFIMPEMDMPMSLAPNSILLKFTEPVMNEYFSFVIKSTYGGKLLNKTQGGSATAKFSKTDLRTLAVPLPPLKEIERIVDRINALRLVIESVV